MSKKLKRALIAAAVLLFGIVNFSSFGNSYDDDDFHFETYTVKPGDTFWTVSHFYRDKDARNLYIFDYQDELRQLNPHIADNGCQLFPGDKIQVRYAEKNSPINGHSIKQ